MLFNSEVFILLFLPVTLAAYFLSRRLERNAYLWVILAASLIFYGYWKFSYVTLLLSSILFNYCIYYFYLKRDLKKSIALFIGIAFNLGLIGYFKYINFLMNDVLMLADIIEAPSPILPLAISFFTFQQISFLVDSKKDGVEDVSLLEYASYVSFFPQLIAGPIVRHDELIPQFHQKTRAAELFVPGVVLFTIGLFKKVVIADSVSVWVTNGYAAIDSLTMSDAWIVALAYTFQLYFDFSGYSDMAVGLGLMFGFRMPFNFNSPYKSLSIQDFWRRWHMTLSRWLRDYLYIPLGGNRHGPSRTYIHLFITMLLGGLWHGAAWTFVIWGALHGGALAVSRYWSRLGIALPVALSWTVTFLFVVSAWVVFRSESMAQATTLLAKMWGFGPVLLPESWAGGLAALGQYVGLRVDQFPAGVTAALPQQAWMILLGLLLITARVPNSQELVGRFEKAGRLTQSLWLIPVGIGFAFALKRLMESSVRSEFLYFQF